MNELNELLVDTLSGLSIDVSQDLYTGKKNKYIVFSYEDDRGELYADNKPKKNRVWMQIHLYLPNNEDYRKLKKEIRSRLFEIGFSYAQIAINTVETETKLRHICFRTEYVTESEV